MSVYLDDLDDAPSIRLHGAGHGGRDSRTEASSEPFRLALPTRGSEDTIVVQLVGEQTVRVGGIATTGQAGGSISSLADWVSALLSRVDGTQGSGYRIRSEYRGRSFEGVLENVQYQREMGSPDQVKWEATLKRGTSLMPLSSNVTSSTGTPSNTATIDGYDLGIIRQQSEEVSQNVMQLPIALNDFEDHPMIPTSGAVREIEIQGSLTGSEASRREFDEYMDTQFAETGTVTYNSAFPGYTLTGQVTDYTSVREGGTTQVGEYSLTLVESIALPDYDLSNFGSSS